MKHLILLTLTSIFALSHGEHCKYCYIRRNGYTLNLRSGLEDIKPIHDIMDVKDESVICGTQDVSRENIKTIEIEGCNFDDLNLFKNCTTLLLLNFWNETKSIGKEDFIGMNQLEHIRIEYSNVEVMTSAFSELPNLKQVDLVKNNVNLSALAFQSAHQLKSLRLLSVPSLPSGLFRDLDGLEHLTLDSSQFTNLSAIDFTGLERLVWLILNKNLISNLTTNSFSNLKSLKYLSVSGNRLSVIESLTFSQLNNLIYLELEFNQITQLNASTFSGLTNLRTLRLEANSIHRIEEDAFSTLKNLRKLDLTNNRLTALDENSFKGLDNLQYLSLKRNFISTMNINTFTPLTKLIELDLRSQYGDGLANLDLNAFPRFIDLQTKTIFFTSIAEPDDFEKQELRWIIGILSFDKNFNVEFGNIYYYWRYFGSFKLHNYEGPKSWLIFFNTD